MNRGRLIAAAIALGAMLLTVPVAAELRSERPPVPRAGRIGVGRLLGGVMTGAFRPLLLNYLWIRSDILHGQQRYEEQLALYRSMTTLYPRNRRAREYLGWTLAFNLKSEARDERLAWAWAREGLEILVEARGDGPRYTDPLADWFLKQCGQNALPPHLLRYAGPEWEREKALRERVRLWAGKRYGKPLDRFELGLFFSESNEQFSGRVTRALLLERMVIDDWVRRGASSRVEKALIGLRWLAGPDGLGDLDPGLVTYFEFRARALEELDRGTVTRGVVEAGGYDAAICLFALGAHGRDPVLLRLAKATLERFEDQPCLEERELLDRWIAYADSGFKGPRPPLPFD